ncbi:MAG: SGNH/GDSL hydrolase family protein [Ruminococcaceae bacterium]|nr:SGNH/GDSL hydrolase family protein [Oscillospiraceae bacterium]
MKKILLLGDSIRMNYQERVIECLKGKAEVRHPPTNCCFSKYTLRFINNWLKLFEGEKPDIIHWNNGIWDTTTISERVPALTNLGEYVDTMTDIYREMRAFAPEAKIIFATTTPLGDRAGTQKRRDRIAQYNSVIVPVLRDEYGCDIDDLYSFVLPHINEYLAEDTVHLSDLGKEKVGEEVARFLEQYL